MAKRHPSSRRRSGDAGSSEPDDVFLAKLIELSTWATTNRQILIAFGVVIAVIVGGVFYYVSFSRSLDEQAAAQLEQIEQTVQMGDPSAARTQLTQYLDRFGGTPSAAEARLALAQLHLAGGQIDEALAVLNDSDVSVREPMGVQIELLRAKTLEAAGQTEEAERAYLRVADSSDLQFMRVDALADAARLRAARGDDTGAAQIYQRILDDLPEGHPDRGLYQMRLAEVQTAARG